jgi:hypothetical protein
MASQSLLYAVKLGEQSTISNALMTSLDRCGAFFFTLDGDVERLFNKLSQEVSGTFYQYHSPASYLE